MWVNARTERDGLLVSKSVGTVYDTHATTVANSVLKVKPNVPLLVLVPNSSDMSMLVKKNWKTVLVQPYPSWKIPTDLNIKDVLNVAREPEDRIARRRQTVGVVTAPKITDADKQNKTLARLDLSHVLNQ